MTVYPTLTRGPVPKGHIEVTVTLNGTGVNPFLEWGLRRNPFPQIGRAEYDHVDRQINELAATPMADAEALRAWLTERRMDPKFIDLCCSLYKPGETVRFRIHFPEGT